MKNTVKTIAFAFILGSTQLFASPTDDKIKSTDIRKVLPENISSIEAPAPQKINTAKSQLKYSAAQKAAIVELRLESQK